MIKLNLKYIDNDTNNVIISLIINFGFYFNYQYS